MNDREKDRIISELLEACQKTSEQLKIIAQIAPIPTWIIGLLDAAIDKAMVQDT